MPLYCRELAQLHSSMHAYLARAGYKLTAMTFAEEAGSHVAGPAQNGTLLSMFQGYQQWQAAMQEAEVSPWGRPILWCSTLVTYEAKIVGRPAAVGGHAGG